MRWTRTHVKELCEQFKLLRDVPASGECEHPVVSNSIQNFQCTHPFVECYIEGVRVRALLDTGSMKSFINYTLLNIIDFNHTLIDQSQASKCISITGDRLDIVGMIPAKVNFIHRKHSYIGNFLVSSNIQYECVLGWDFITSNNLALVRDREARAGYLLEGSHGVTPIRNNNSKDFLTENLAGIIQARAAGTDRVLCQSEYSGCAAVSLVNSVMLPARTELIVEGKVAKSVKSSVGMIAPISRDNEYRQGFHLAHVVVTPNEDRVVPLMVINMSHTQMELPAGEHLADFYPLVESCTKNSVSNPDICGAVGNTDTFEHFSDKVDHVIDDAIHGDDRKRVTQLLYKYADVFNDQLGHTTLVSHNIDTGNHAPIKQHPRRLPYAYREEANRQTAEMLEQGIIRPSTSAWSSPIVLVKKKGGELRFCVDYRKLNSVTIGHAHPLPRIDDILDSLGDSKLFSCLDLKSGYWQLSVNEADRHKTAFVTQSGLYEFNRMPFGLSMACATFQRTMEIVLAGLTYDICLCYLDDVIVFGRSLAEHCNRLESVLLRLREHNLRVKLTKCKFVAPKVHYLGHVISQTGIQPDPQKISAVSELPTPQSVKEVRSFLGLAGYYRRFIPGFATISAPLVRLTQKNVHFIWSAECDTAFTTLKTLLCSSPILSYPKFDRQFTLQTDASDFGAGAVLSQVNDQGLETVVAYASKALSAQQRKFSATEKEAYAIVFGTQYFRVYLLGRPFEIITDHNALRWLHTMEPKGRIARWIMDLQEFQFTVRHRAGRLHTNADALSRLVSTDTDNSYNASSCRSPIQVSTNTECSSHSTPSNVTTKIQLKFSNGRQTIIKVEKKLKTNDTGNTSSNTQRTGPRSDNNSDNVDKESGCAISVNPRISFKEAQLADPEIARIMDRKKRGLGKPKLARNADPTLKHMCRVYDSLFLRDDLLVRAIGNRQTHPNHVIVVPECLKEEILHAVHDSPFAGHLGITRTEERIRKRFYWPGIRTSVEEHIRKCPECSKKTTPNQENRAPMGRIDVGEPFTFWAMDYMGPLPETIRGNKHVLVVVDHFTKWCEIIPTKDQKASTVAPLLINKIFSRFGPPVVLHSDQGRNFESNLMHEICDAMGIVKTRTTAYHPQCDGQTERQNRTIQQMLSSFVSNRQDDWDLWLDSVTYAYNTSKHESLGLSPYEVVFGRVPRLPFELEVGMPISNPATQNEYVRNVRSVFKDIRQIAKNNLSKITEDRIRQNQRAKPWQPFGVGEAVMLKRPKG